MEHNKSVIFLIVGLITVIVLFTFSVSFAYEAINQESVSTWTLRTIFNHTNYTSEAKSEYTHRWAQHPFLTRSAIKLFEDYKGRDIFTDEQERLIIRGSIEEDTDVPPSLSMNKNDLPSFCDDPEHYLITTSFDVEVKNRPWYDDHLHWYDHQRCLNHFDPAILQEVLDGSEPRRATEFAQFFKKIGQGNVSANHFAWENISLVDENLQLIMLGHVLHLLEDMGCPPHTRGDKHGGKLGGGESDYEKILGEHFFGINYTTPNSARIRSSAQIENLEDLENPPALTDYFESLRNLSQKGYFSRNTMFSDDYEQNFIPVNDENGNYVYKNFVGGTKLARKGPDFWQSLQNNAGLIIGRRYSHLLCTDQDVTVMFYVNIILIHNLTHP